MARKPRKKAPRSRLTPTQRQQDRSPLYDPVQPLRGHRLAEAARAMTDVEYKPQLGALDRQSAVQGANETALEGRTGGYYRQLAEQEAGRQDRMRAITSGLQGQLATAGQQAGQRLDEAQATAGRSLANVPPGLEGGGKNRLAEELAAARARAATDQQQAQNTAATQGANYGGLLAAGGQAQGLRGQEILRQFAVKGANKQAELADKRTTLEGARGAAIIKNVTGLRKEGFENLATLRALGTDEAKVAAQMDQAASDDALARARLGESARHNRAQEDVASGRLSLGRTREDRIAFKEDFMRRHHLGSFTPSSVPEGQRKVLDQISNTAWDYQRLLHKPRNGKPRTSKEVMDSLRASGKTSPQGRQAARDIAEHGYLLPETARQLQASGIVVPPEWRMPPRQRRPS